MQMMQVRWSLGSSQGKRKSTTTDYMPLSKRSCSLTADHEQGDLNAHMLPVLPCVKHLAENGNDAEQMQPLLQDSTVTDAVPAFIDLLAAQSRLQSLIAGLQTDSVPSRACCEDFVASNTIDADTNSWALGCDDDSSHSSTGTTTFPEDLGDIGDLEALKEQGDGGLGNSSAATAQEAEAVADGLLTTSYDGFELLRTFDEKESKGLGSADVAHGSNDYRMDILDPEWFGLPSIDVGGGAVFGCSEGMCDILENPLFSIPDSATPFGDRASAPLLPSSSSGKPIGTPLIVMDKSRARKMQPQQSHDVQFVPLALQTMVDMSSDRQSQLLGKQVDGNQRVNRASSSRSRSLIWHGLKVIPMK